MNKTKTGEDPTKAILSESALSDKYLCDYVINVATGCRHGCRFCYVPATPNIRTRGEMLEEEVGVEDGQREWGDYVLYRDGLAERLDGHLDRKRTWNESEKGCGVVGISFHTDCYMDKRAGDITRGVIEALADHQKHARILTRNPLNAVRHLETFQAAGEYVTIGSSINSLDAAELKAIERNAPTPEARLKGLQRFANAGVQTYVSMSPTYPTMGKSDIRELMERLADVDPAVIFHEPINPRGANYEMTVAAAEEAGQDDLARALVEIQGHKQWLDYALKHFRWVQELAEELSLPVHLWPDKALLDIASGEQERYLREWRERQSPEQFAGRDTPDSPMPRPPRTEQTTITPE